MHIYGNWWRQVYLLDTGSINERLSKCMTKFSILVFWRIRLLTFIAKSLLMLTKVTFMCSCLAIEGQVHLPGARCTMERLEHINLDLILKTLWTLVNFWLSYLILTRHLHSGSCVWQLKERVILIVVGCHLYQEKL